MHIFIVVCKKKTFVCNSITNKYRTCTEKTYCENLDAIKMLPTKKYFLTIRSDTMFSKEDYGKPISKRLSTVLRRTTSKDDLANIALRSNVSFSTIRDVVYRTNSLTKSNAKAIALLVHVAFENAIATKLQAEGDIIHLDKMLRL